MAETLRPIANVGFLSDPWEPVPAENEHWECMDDPVDTPDEDDYIEVEAAITPPSSGWHNYWEIDQPSQVPATATLRLWMAAVDAGIRITTVTIDDAFVNSFAQWVGVESITNTSPHLIEIPLNITPGTYDFSRSYVNIEFGTYNGEAGTAAAKIYALELLLDGSSGGGGGGGGGGGQIGDNASFFLHLCGFP